MLRSTASRMNFKRTATIVVVGGVFAAWLANAMTPVGRAPAASISGRARPVEARDADLAKEITRLHDRLRPEAVPSTPGRNLFEFRKARAVAVAEPRVETQPALLAAAPQMPLTLAGIAEDGGASGVVRTAIISATGQLFLVKEGEEVSLRYRVAAITADGVDLRDASDGSLRHLSLK